MSRPGGVVTETEAAEEASAMSPYLSSGGCTHLSGQGLLTLDLIIIIPVHVLYKH